MLTQSKIGVIGVGHVGAHVASQLIWARIHALVDQVKESAASVVLGVGGGKALDTAKAVAEQAGVPVVMLPTLAATCAAVSAVSVIYDAQGHYVGLCKLAKTPDAVILDPALIATAPVRWLAAMQRVSALARRR